GEAAPLLCLHTRLLRCDQSGHCGSARPEGWLTLSRLSQLPGRLGALTALAAAACLSGCAAYRPMHIDARRSLAAFEARRLDAPGLRHYLQQALRRPVKTWPLRSWDFEQLVAAADYYSADL